MKEHRKETSKRIDWNKYADFRSRKSKQDLIRVCSRVSSVSKLSKIFETADESGLLPIHWAAIHNRFDLIEFMLDRGSPIRVPCRNKLFADGTELHLASMNGSIQAASTLLRRFQSDENKPQRESTESNQTIPKSLIFSDVSGGSSSEPAPVRNSRDWLADRDSEGQTALMRSAPPRSKRLDTVRELLKKNLWSLGGRPAEMALFLINRGADWRETDSLYHMNLLHLAIINGYDDIVNMLIVIDKQLLTVLARPLDNKIAATRIDKEARREDELVSIDLAESQPTSASSNSSTPDDNKSLLSKKERSDQLIGAGLTPLQLAIVYGRLRIISILWHATEASLRETVVSNSLEEEVKRRIESNNELRRTLFKAFWSNISEVSDLVRKATLKAILLLDLTLLVLFWVPLYMNWQSGVFLLSFCLTISLAFRVMLKNPGYARRSSVQYTRELASLVLSNTEQPTETGNEPATDNTNSQEPVEERVRLLCHRCKCLRRPRTRHCYHCQHCVQDFDHHCIYLGCCIGRYNRLDFLLLMLLMSITSIYGSVLFSNDLIHEEWNHFWSYVILLSILKYAIVGVISSFCILRRASLGVTMYEQIRSRRIRQLFGPEGAPSEISDVIKMYSSSNEPPGSKPFWRYMPNRFLTGDLSNKRIGNNLREFTSFASAQDYLISLLCSDTNLANYRTSASNDMRINLRDFV